MFEQDPGVSILGYAVRPPATRFKQNAMERVDTTSWVRDLTLPTVRMSMGPLNNKMYADPVRMNCKRSGQHANEQRAECLGRGVQLEEPRPLGRWVGSAWPRLQQKPDPGTGRLALSQALGRG